VALSKLERGHRKSLADRTVILSREDGEGSQDAVLLRFLRSFAPLRMTWAESIQWCVTAFSTRRHSLDCLNVWPASCIGIRLSIPAPCERQSSGSRRAD